MSKTLRIPTEAQLPRGARRYLVTDLFVLYKLANRPTLRDIATQIQSKDSRRGTASQETVRKILHGKAVPSWLTFVTFLEALCELAGVELSANPQDIEWNWDSFRTVEEHFNVLWNSAMDEPPARSTPAAPAKPIPRVSYQPRPQVQVTTNYDEEPPF